MMMNPTTGNTLEYLLALLAHLHQHAITCVVFGGWAEELLGLSPARPHHDVDLLYRGESFEPVDRFLQGGEEMIEVAAKRFSHKRAFTWGGVLVEIILVSRWEGEFETRFFNGEVRLVWPVDVFQQTCMVGGMAVPVASQAALRMYRERYPAVHQAYQSFTAK